MIALILRGDAWINLSLPNCENKGEVSPINLST